MSDFTFWHDGEAGGTELNAVNLNTQNRLTHDQSVADALLGFVAHGNGPPDGTQLGMYIDDNSGQVYLPSETSPVADSTDLANVGLQKADVQQAVTFWDTSQGVYTLQATDADSKIIFTSAGGSAQSVIIPNSATAALLFGSRIRLYAQLSGGLIITADPLVTVDPPQSPLTVAQYGTAVVEPISNNYVNVSGDRLVPLVVPKNVSAPVVTPAGTQQTGTVLTATSGIWNPAFVSAPTYQWKRDGVTNIGTNSPNYTLVGADETHAVTCTVTVSNGAGAGTTAISNVITAIAVVGVAPANTVLPVLSATGSARGQVATLTQGTWTGSAITYTYEFLRDGGVVQTGAATTYTFVDADVGHVITGRVKATNAAGGPITATAAASFTIVSPSSTVLFGLNVTDNYTTAVGMSDGTRTTLQTAMANGGMKLGRIVINWKFLIPTAGASPNFAGSNEANFDKMVGDLANRGIEPLIMLFDAPAAYAKYSITGGQTVKVSNATGGTFTLTFSGQTTAAIAWNASASTLQTALENLSNIAPGDLTVTSSGAAGSQAYTVQFLNKGAYGGQSPANMTSSTTSLTGTGKTVVMTAISKANSHVTAVATADLAAWDNYIDVVVRRYGPKVGADATTGTYWRANPGVPYHPCLHIEVGNEENAGNGGFWWGTNLSSAAWKTSTVAPGEYAVQYQRARNVARAVDPSVLVCIGGLTEGPSSTGNVFWMTNVMAAIPTLVVDAIAIHPYGKYNNNANSIADGNASNTSINASFSFTTIKRLRTFMNGYRDPGNNATLAAVPIWVTEWGHSVYTGTGTKSGSWDTGLDPGGTTTAQANANWANESAMCVHYFSAGDCNITVFTAFAAVRAESSTSNRDDWMGYFFKANGTARAQFTAMTNGNTTYPGGILGFQSATPPVAPGTYVLA